MAISYKNKVEFNKIVIDHLHLVYFYLEKENVKNDDIKQDAYIILINCVRNYFKEKKNDDIDLFLNENLREKLNDLIAKKEKGKNINNNAFYIDDDFITKLEEKEYVNSLEKFMFNTTYFTFMQKTILMAKLGFIGNYVLKNSELAKALNCTSTNIYNKYIDCIYKLKRAVYYKRTEKDYNYSPDLFMYFNTSKEIVIDLMKKCLNEKEISVLKQVWGDDFSSLNHFDDIKLSKDEIITYYNAIGKLYDAILHLDINDELKLLGLDYGYALKR